jgi:hypothetical protein
LRQSGLTLAPEQSDRDYLTDEALPARPVDRERRPAIATQTPRPDRERRPATQTPRPVARTPRPATRSPRTATATQAPRPTTRSPRSAAPTRQPATARAERAAAPTRRATSERPERPAPRPSATNRGGVPGRRTVTIQGRGADRSWAPVGDRRRPARRPHERAGFRPDRAALWAVMLGFVLVLVAATSSHAAVRAHVARAGAGRAAVAAHVVHRADVGAGRGAVAARLR